METTTRRSVTIRGFSFDWILFPNLRELFRVRRKLSCFNCVDNRFGVYYFLDESGSAPYVGLCGTQPKQTQYMKVRIRQYFKPSLDSGNSFGKRWMLKNDRTYQCFQSYIANLQLATLSIIRTDLSCEQQKTLMKDPGVLREMEKVLICKFKPAYNDPFYNILTDDEQNNLTSFVESVANPPTENAPGG